MASRPDFFHPTDYISTRELIRAYEPHVSPLTEQGISQVLRLTISETQNEAATEALAQLSDRNQQIYQQSPTLGLYLNARVGYHSQGWIGDMIEAARLIPALLEDGKRVVLLTSHPDLFLGYQSNKLTIHEIPPDVNSTPNYPWNPDILRFVHQKTHTAPTVFPMNASMPVLFFTESNGTLKNSESAELVKRAFHPLRTRNQGILPKDWGKACHQLHALQVFADLIGVRTASHWGEFPHPPLKPSHSAELVAKNAIDATGLDPSQAVLIVHPGTATNDHKVTSKYYPLNCWQAALSELIPDLLRADFATLIMTPNDFQQAGDCMGMIDYLKTKGLTKISLFPSPEKFGYQTLPLNAFVSAIDQLKDRAIMLGLDSMPAGHLAPAFGIPTVVVGNYIYRPNFYCPPNNSLVVLPPHGCTNASDVNAHNVAQATRYFLSKKIP